MEWWADLGGVLVVHSLDSSGGAVVLGVSEAAYGGVGLISLLGCVGLWRRLDLCLLRSFWSEGEVSVVDFTLLGVGGIQHGSLLQGHTSVRQRGGKMGVVCCHVMLLLPGRTGDLVVTGCNSDGADLVKYKCHVIWKLLYGNNQFNIKESAHHESMPLVGIQRPFAMLALHERSRDTRV